MSATPIVDDVEAEFAAERSAYADKPAHDVPIRSLDEAGELIARLMTEVDWLTSKIAQLQHSVSTEVRTRRIVVVDAEGAERIYSEIGSGEGGYAQLRVEWHGAEPWEMSSAVLQASNEISDAGEAYVYVMAGAENSVAEMRAYADRETQDDPRSRLVSHGTVSAEEHSQYTGDRTPRLTPERYIVAMNGRGVQAGRDWPHFEAQAVFSYKP